MVDDDPQTLRYVRDALAAAGFVPLVTGDPRELAYLLQTHRPQLVLLDLMLPGADGIEWRWCAETSVRRGPGHRDGRRGMIST